jgi:hypothetical protein
MHKQLIALYSLSVLLLIGFTENLLLPATAIAQTQDCGIPGREGTAGRDGRSGISGETEFIIRASDQLQTHTLIGADGENGENGSSGENAQQCMQPDEPTFNLIGAKGG